MKKRIKKRLLAAAPAAVMIFGNPGTGSTAQASSFFSDGQNEEIFIDDTRGEYDDELFIDDTGERDDLFIKEADGEEEFIDKTDGGSSVAGTESSLMKQMMIQSPFLSKGTMKKRKT